MLTFLYGKTKWRWRCLNLLIATTIYTLANAGVKWGLLAAMCHGNGEVMCHPRFWRLWKMFLLSTSFSYNGFKLSMLWQYRYSQGYYITISQRSGKGQSLRALSLTSPKRYVLYLKSHNGLFPLWGPFMALFKPPWTRGRHGTEVPAWRKEMSRVKRLEKPSLKIVLLFFVKAYRGWTPCMTHISLWGN